MDSKDKKSTKPSGQPKSIEFLSTISHPSERQLFQPQWYALNTKEQIPNPRGNQPDFSK
jgi:hypothetical protein